MKDFLFTRIPSLCICFTLITLTSALIDMLRGAPSGAALPILFLWLAACQLVDILLGKINFKKWMHYCLAESALLYLLSLLFFRLLYWESFSLQRLLSFTAIFLVTDIFIFWYFRKRRQLQAAEINALLDREHGN